MNKKGHSISQLFTVIIQSFNRLKNIFLDSDCEDKSFHYNCVFQKKNEFWLCKLVNEKQILTKHKNETKYSRTNEVTDQRE